MDDRQLEADYVVVGAGAVAMSFVDVILSESDATVIMVDRRAHPGGHWNDAYSFVRLHQPSHFYGVNSTPLGRGRKDESGTNAGLFELATGDEVRGYFDLVMRDRFLPSGRVRYLPMSDYAADGVVTSLLTGARTCVRARKKVVNATYVGSEVPSTRPPPFEVASGVDLVPVNGLARLDRPRDAYVIIGAGKTGADACLWLLTNDVDPSAIVWVRPRDSWFFDRACFQGGGPTVSSFATQLEVVAQADTVEDIFVGFERAGQVLRIDLDHWPTMFRFSTMARGEAELLRRITNVVRLGHVLRAEREGLVLERGTVPSAGDWLFVDCTAAGVPYRPPVPLFEDGKITLQYIMYTGQPTFSGALTALIESAYDDDDRKNSLCTPLPISGQLLDVPYNLLNDLKHREQWLSEPRIRDWMATSRLDPTTGIGVEAAVMDDELLGRFLVDVGPARSSLEGIVSDLCPSP
jgi:hypothetical protein